MSSRLLTITLGLSLLITTYVGVFTAGVPTIYCPFPTLTTVPALVLSTKHLEYVALLLPMVMFFAWNPRLLTDPGPRVPRRTPVLLAVLTVLTVVDFIYEWPYGVRYHGIHYTRAIYALDSIWLLTIWWILIRCLRQPSFSRNLLSHFLIFAWLGWYAFPYLGELP